MNKDQDILRIYDDEKGHCKYCRRADPVKKAYCKTLDKRLVEIAFEAFQYLLDTQRKTFRTKDIWTDHHKLTDMQKLGYWDIFRKVHKKSGYWKITETGYKFLTGKTELPRKVWIRDWIKLGEPVRISEETVSINDLMPRWQQGRSDWTLDYIRVKHKPEQTQLIKVGTTKVNPT